MNKIIFILVILLSCPFCYAAVPEIDLTGLTESDVKANGISIHYIRSGGDKPPLILAHGMTGNYKAMMLYANAFKNEYDVIAYDARGHGESSRTDKQYSYQDSAEDILGLIKALQLKKPILIGHSMGSYSCGLFSAKYPEIPKSVILEDPPLGIAKPEDKERFEAHIKQISDVKKHLLSFPNKTFDPDVTLMLDEMMGKFYLEEYFPTIECPTLILKSGKGITKDYRIRVNKIAERLSKGKLIYFDDAGHGIHFEQPEKTIKIVKQFLNSLNN